MARGGREPWDHILGTLRQALTQRSGAGASRTTLWAAGRPETGHPMQAGKPLLLG